MMENRKLRRRRPGSGRVFAVLAAWVLLWSPVSSVLRAQTYESFQTERERIYTDAIWRLGPFRIDPALRLDFQYDSNIYGSSEDRDPVSDYVVTVSTPLTFYLLHRDWLIFSLTETPQLVYYLEVDSQRSFNNSYSPELRLLLLNRFVVSGAYRYDRAKERFLAELETPVVRTIDGWNGSLFYETARNTSIGLTWSELQVRYDNIGEEGAEVPIARGLNRREKNRSADLYYSLLPEASLFMRFSLSTYLFDDPESSFKDSDSFRFDLGVRLPETGRLRGMLSLGYRSLVPKQDGLMEFRGIVGDTDLEVRLGRMNFRALYQKDAAFSYGMTDIFYTRSSYGAGVSLYLSQNIRLDYNFRYGENGYPEQPADTSPEGAAQRPARKDLYRTHSGGVVIRILRDTGIGLTANYYVRESNLFTGMERWLYGAFVTYDF